MKQALKKIEFAPLNHRDNMTVLEIIHTGTVVYNNRHRIKRIAFAVIFAILLVAFFIYIIITTAFAVIQGGSNVTDNSDDSGIPFTEFVSFRYKTISSEKWYDYTHPYFFPTLGSLTQGVILDSSAKVGLRHVAWDIADRKDRRTEVKAFSEGIIASVNNNILYNTTRRWRFCDSSPSGICWYEVQERADIQIACGFEVIIQHPDSLRSQYCHLASEPFYAVGDTIPGGQTIGYQGSTGWATGKHLHFALWRGGQPIDPSYAFSQTSLTNWNQ